MYRNPTSTKAQDNSLKRKTTKETPKNQPPSKGSSISKSTTTGGSEKSKHKIEIPSLYENGTPTEFINGAIHEYFLYYGLHGSVTNFMGEMAHTLNEKKNSDLNSEAQFLEIFDKGQREAFFKKWESYVPANIRSIDEFCNKLEFYLHMYFVLFNIHPFTKKSPQKKSIKQGDFDKHEMQIFKNYLDTKGHEFAQTSEFLQYYALPYIPNPLSHASFQDVFTKEWLQDLRGKLQSFLGEVGTQSNLPVLYQMLNAYKKGINETNNSQSQGQADTGEYAKLINQLESNNQGLVNVLQETREKYEALEKNYDLLKKNEEAVKHYFLESNVKWLNLLKEMVSLNKESLHVLDSQRSGASVSSHVISGLRERQQWFENFLSSNQEEFFSNSQDNSFFEKGSVSLEPTTPDHMTLANVPDRFHNAVERAMGYTQSYIEINFEKVKSFLVNRNNPENSICSLLQALCWRISKTSEIGLRRELILSYAKNDLLDLNRGEPCVIKNIFEHESKRVQEFAGRLTNILTLDYYGRNYLLSTELVITILISILKREKGDTNLRKNCLGALQKLSLRRNTQILMINLDIIKWIVNTLKHEKNSLSEYSFEYITALFMNLSLRSLGKQKCEELDMEVLKALNDLLEHENRKVRSFINGTLYSLLSKPVFKEHAKILGMNEAFKYLLENSDESYSKQIQYILDRLNEDKVDDDSQSDGNDEDNDNDDMDDENDFDEEENMDESTDPTAIEGEELLKRYLSLSVPVDTLHMNYTINETLNESRTQTITRQLTQKDLHSPLNRPITPRKLNKLLQQESDQITYPEGFTPKPKIPRTPLEGSRENLYLNPSGSQNYLPYQASYQHQQQYLSQGYEGRKISANTKDQRLVDSTNREIPKKISQEKNVRPIKREETSYSGSENIYERSTEIEKKKEAPVEFVEAFVSKPKLTRSPQKKFTGGR